MKTPVLKLLPKHSGEVLDNTIYRALINISNTACVDEDIYPQLRNALYSLCYKIFFTGGKFAVNSSYSISDACFYLPGMFKSNMINYLNNIIDFCNTETKSNTEKLLKDCLSLELLQMLYCEPVKLYAAMLYNYGYKYNDKELMDLGREFILLKSLQPTLDWERLYLKVTERCS